jgi:RecA-family ATPase
MDNDEWGDLSDMPGTEPKDISDVAKRLGPKEAGKRFKQVVKEKMQNDPPQNDDLREFGIGGNNNHPTEKTGEPKPLRPMPSWIDYGVREVDPTLYHIGNGFMEIGGISMLIGQSYVGKSTFLTQVSIYGAIGKDWLIFKFHRPLKFLIVQAEDPENKLVKMGQMYRRMGLTEAQIALVATNTAILTIRGLTGNEAIAEIERHAEVVKPDVIAINPLSSFCSSVYKDEEINHFLRVLFSGLLDRQKSSGLVVAHPPKPSFDKDTREMTQFELQYTQAGMAAITNVSRSNMFLTHVHDDVFNLTVGKGFDDLGMSESVAAVCRSKDEKGIMLWERCESEKAEEAHEKEVQRKSPKNRGKGVVKYEDLLKKFRPTDSFSKDKMYEVSPRGRDWTNSALKELVREKKLVRRDKPNPEGGPVAHYQLPTVLEPE